ncbi:ribbon-helix-helix protein, CopG family [bacterium]|nr:ribbon-helix-helix protein, CopG family [bacterium]
MENEHELKQVTSISIDPELQERIKWEAKWRGISRSEFIRDAIKVYLAALEKQGKAAPGRG